MKNKYCITVILLILSMKLLGQEVRVNNSFVILVNDKLVTTVAGLQLILTDSTQKQDIIKSGYYPGVLYVNSIGAKNILYTDTTKF